MTLNECVRIAVMVLEEDVCLHLNRKLSDIGLHISLVNIKDIGNLLDQLLKILLEEKGGITITTKLNVATFIELEAVHLLTNIADVELMFAIFKNVFEASSEEHCAILKGQSLISATSILLQSLEKWPVEELEMLFTEHVNFLLTLVRQNNKASNVYVRSVAANCLVELELCFPNLLRECLDIIYMASIGETSVAHQQYMTLLALIVKHSLIDGSLKTPLWGKWPRLQLKSVFLTQEVAALSFYDLNQIVSFLMDHLPLCTCEGMIWIATQLISMMMSKTELQASTQVLKPLLFNYVYTYNVPAFHIVLMLERRLGNALFQEQDHKLLLQQLLLNSSHPALPACTKLIYLDYLRDYLIRRSQKTITLQCIPVLFLGAFDGPETQLKKLNILSMLLKDIEEPTTLLQQEISRLQTQMYYRSSVKFKSALSRTLFRYLSDYEALNVNDDISRIVLSTAMDDVTIAPFALNFVGKVQMSFPGSSLPSSILTSLVAAYTKPDSPATLPTLHFVIDVFLTAVLQNCSLDECKAILVYLLKYIVCDEVHNMLSWTLGHQILYLCYNLMRECDTTYFFYELSDVLKAFISKCDDVDQQDRAQLYYSLLVSLSNKKMKAVVKAPKQTLTSMMAHESTFNSISTIHSLHKPVLKLKKIKRKMLIEKEDIQTMENEPKEDILQVYKKYMDSTSSERKLVLRIAIDFAQDFHENIGAVAIFFTLPESWSHIEPIMVGHLDKMKVKTVGNKHEEAYVFDVLCFPTKPHPALAEVRAEFSLEDMCHSCILDPLEIEFLDFFNPLPVPDMYVCSSSLWRSRLFLTLWNSYEAGCTSHSSVHVLHGKKENINCHLIEKLDTFIVENNCDNLCCVGIFLPPTNHLLMKFEILEDKTIIKIRTDDLHVLAFTNVFFKSWT